MTNRPIVYREFISEEEVKCKKFWLWCFLNKNLIDKLTGYYNINERVDMIYKLYKKETE